jgi:hypothetical protein
VILVAKIESVNDFDFKKYKDIFIKAEYLGMTLEEAVKVVEDDGTERILFVCGSIWMIFGYRNGILKYNTFLVNDDKVVSFTMNDYQVNVNDNMVYLIYENGKHESLQLFRNDVENDFDVSNNGLVVHMQYNSKEDVRTISKYEHCVYGDNSKIYGMRLNEPYEVIIEKNASKRDKGMKFIGEKSSYYRLDFDIYNNRWQYDLATIQEFGLGAVLSNNTISLQNGVKKFSKFYKVLFSCGDYFTLTGFPFLRQYSSSDVNEYVKDCGFNIGVSDELVEIFNNRDNYTRDFQDIVLLYNCRMILHHSI